MSLVLTQDLNEALNSAHVYYETQGTRILYETKDFYLSAEIPDGDDTEFQYRSYDVSDKEVTLTDDQITIVFKFVKDLHDTEKQKQKDHQNYLD